MNIIIDNVVDEQWGFGLYFFKKEGKNRSRICLVFYKWGLALLLPDKK